MIESKNGQRLAGMVILVIGMFLTAYAWDVKVATQKLRVFGALFGPMAVVFGAGMTLVPFDFPAFRARTGRDKPEKLADYPLPWKVMIVAGFAAGLASLAMLLTR